MNWNNNRTNSNNNVGLRCDCGFTSNPPQAEQWSDRDMLSCLGRNLCGAFFLVGRTAEDQKDQT